MIHQDEKSGVGITLDRKPSPEIDYYKTERGHSDPEVLFATDFPIPRHVNEGLKTFATIGNGNEELMTTSDSL